MNSRVLHVVSTLDPAFGGVAQAIRAFIAGSAGDGTIHEVLSVDAPQSRWPGDEGFAFHALGPGRFRISYSARLRPWLKTNLARFGAVICHGLWLYPSAAVRREWEAIGRQGKSRPKLYVMPHGMLDPYFQRDPSRRLKALRNVLYWRAVECRLVNVADGLLFTCEEERRLARETFRPYQPRREDVVGLGIAEPPTPTFAMSAAFVARGGPIRPGLLFLSRLHPKKGADLLLQAYSRVAAEVFLPPLVIAGPCTDPAIRDGLETLARELGFVVHSGSTPSTPVNGAPELHLLGMLTGDAKWGALHSCEAFVLPSHQENFGVAVVEALACGKPVLISNRVNIWREIESDGAGFVGNDTLEGTLDLLRSWARRRGELSPDIARACFQRHFSLAKAASNLRVALFE